MNDLSDFIGRLVSISPVQRREVLTNGQTRVVTASGEVLTLERLTDYRDPRVDESRYLLAQAFDANAVDDVETIRTAMRGVVVGDESSEDIPLLVHVIEDKNGLIVGTAHSAVVPMRDEEGEDSQRDAVSHVVQVSATARMAARLPPET